jgi:hypothetical protein
MKSLRPVFLAFLAGTLMAAMLALTSTSVSAAPTPGATPPSITGDPRVGSTLTASRGGWYGVSGGFGGLNPQTFYSYKWFRDGILITGLDGRKRTYVPVPTDVGSRISVSVVAFQVGSDPVTGPRSAETNPVLPGILTAGTPSVVGKRQPGNLLKVEPGTWSPAPVNFEAGWYVDNILVHGCMDASCDIDDFILRSSETNSRELHLLPADVGKPVKVVVYGSKPGYITKSRTVSGGYVQPASPQP